MTLILKDKTVQLKNTTVTLASEMMFALGVAAAIFHFHGSDCVVTSALDGHHNINSLHPKGLAIDLRTKNLDESTVRAIHNELRDALRPFGFDIVLEHPLATVATTAAHLHIEYDPKQRDLWMTMTSAFPKPEQG